MQMAILTFNLQFWEESGKVVNATIVPEMPVMTEFRVFNSIISTGIVVSTWMKLHFVVYSSIIYNGKLQFHTTFTTFHS